MDFFSLSLTHSTRVESLALVLPPADRPVVPPNNRLNPLSQVSTSVALIINVVAPPPPPLPALLPPNLPPRLEELEEEKIEYNAYIAKTSDLYVL